MISKLTRYLFVLLAACDFAIAGAAEFRDPFQSAELAGRRAMRGPWQIAGGTAKCTQDDELYKQFKDHGPIIFYDVPLTDGVIHFRYKPHGAKTFVFTLNGADGHVFRFVTSEAGTNLRGFPPGTEAKSIALKVDAAKKLSEGQWTDVTVTIRGTKAEVKVGDAPPLVAEHESLARPKTNISLGYSFGTLEISDFSVSP